MANADYRNSSDQPVSSCQRACLYPSKWNNQSGYHLDTSQQPLPSHWNSCCKPGLTLTIEPGTTVDIAQYSIGVGGTLSAVGTSDNPIIFQTSYQYMNIRIQFLTASTACTVGNTVFNSVSLSISNSSPKINNNYFTNNQYTAITVSGGSPLI